MKYLNEKLRKYEEWGGGYEKERQKKKKKGRYMSGWWRQGFQVYPISSMISPIEMEYQNEKEKISKRYGSNFF